MKTTDFIIKIPKTPAILQPEVQEPAPVELTMPEFTFESAEEKFAELISEDATAGASCAGTISAVVSPLGQGPKDIIRRQTGYTNQLSKGGPVKVKK